MPGLPKQFPAQSPWQTRRGQGTDAQPLGHPFFEQYEFLLPVGNSRRLNSMEPIIKFVLRVADSKTTNCTRLMDFFMVDGDCLRRLMRIYLFKREVYKL